MAESFVSTGQFGEFSRRMDERFDAVNQRFDAADQRFDAVNQRFDDMYTHFNERFNLVDKRFDAVNQRFDDMYAHFNERFNLVDKRFDDMNLHVSQRHDDTMQAISDLRAEMRQMRQWLIGTLVTFVVGFGLLLLKEFLFN